MFFPFHSSTCTIPLHLQFKLCVYLRILFGQYWKNVPSVVTIYKHQQIIQALRQRHMYLIITDNNYSLTILSNFTVSFLQNGEIEQKHQQQLDQRRVASQMEKLKMAKRELEQEVDTHKTRLRLHIEAQVC